MLTSCLSVLVCLQLSSSSCFVAFFNVSFVSVNESNSIAKTLPLPLLVSPFSPLPLLSHLFIMFLFPFFPFSFVKCFFCFWRRNLLSSLIFRNSHVHVSRPTKEKGKEGRKARRKQRGDKSDSRVELCALFNSVQSVWIETALIAR